MLFRVSSLPIYLSCTSWTPSSATFLLFQVNVVNRQRRRVVATRLASCERSRVGDTLIGLQRTSELPTNSREGRGDQTVQSRPSAKLLRGRLLHIHLLTRRNGTFALSQKALNKSWLFHLPLPSSEKRAGQAVELTGTPPCRPAFRARTASARDGPC